ncbi:hypothetical protein AAG570_011327 [Ranatra chinensis]|uniref:Uncharacterized protein n=1 Tax=Ranatra chinensis TaxID=642074 RepID=A0ABD0Z8L6_9HEMI
MASKCRKVFYENKKQETTVIVSASNGTLKVSFEDTSRVVDDDGIPVAWSVSRKQSRKVLEWEDDMMALDVELGFPTLQLRGADGLWQAGDMGRGEELSVKITCEDSEHGLWEELEHYQKCESCEHFLIGILCVSTLCNAARDNSGDFGGDMIQKFGSKWCDKKQISSANVAMWVEVKSKLSTENKLTLYNAILKPTWTYGAELWGSAKMSNLDRIQAYQSKVLRIILDALRSSERQARPVAEPPAGATVGILDSRGSMAFAGPRQRRRLFRDLVRGGLPLVPGLQRRRNLLKGKRVEIRDNSCASSVVQAISTPGKPAVEKVR